jgi:hypothetical protein
MFLKGKEKKPILGVPGSPQMSGQKIIKSLKTVPNHPLNYDWKTKEPWWRVPKNISQGVFYRATSPLPQLRQNILARLSSSLGILGPEAISFTRKQLWRYVRIPTAMQRKYYFRTSTKPRLSPRHSNKTGDSFEKRIQERSVFPNVSSALFTSDPSRTDSLSLIFETSPLGDEKTQMVANSVLLALTRRLITFLKFFKLQCFLNLRLLFLTFF